MGNTGTFIPLFNDTTLAFTTETPTIDLSGLMTGVTAATFRLLGFNQTVDSIFAMADTAALGNNFLRLNGDLTPTAPPAATTTPTPDPIAVTTITDSNGNPIPDGSIPPVIFGLTPAGTAPTQTLRISNTSSTLFQLGDLQLPEEFSIVGTFPTELAANSSFPLTLQFNPDSSGLQGGIVGFQVGDEFYNFNIEGTGELPVPSLTAPDGTNPALPDPAINGSEDTDDLITGTTDADAILGFGGNDTLDGADGNDFLFGWSGDDNITGGAGDDFARGGSGNDVLIGDTATVNETGGNDTLIGGAGNDLLLGQKGDDVLSGEAGDDTLNGGMGNDLLFGGAGNDIIAGDLGDDILIGNDGVDTFVVGQGSDVIQDFLNGTDLIQLPSGVGFSDLTITNDAVNTTITTADNSFTVTLENVISTLTASNFV